VTELDARAIRHLVIHYSAANADEQSDHRNCARRVRAIQNYHMTASPSDPTKPWSDIAYSWLFCKHGYIYRGRGIAAKSAATGPANSYTVAACFLGDDTVCRDDVTPAGRGAILEIRDFVERNAPNFQSVKCHRDFMQTTCPGDELTRFVRALGT